MTYFEDGRGSNFVAGPLGGLIPFWSRNLRIGFTGAEGLNITVDPWSIGAATKDDVAWVPVANKNWPEDDEETKRAGSSSTFITVESDSSHTPIAKSSSRNELLEEDESSEKEELFTTISSARGEEKILVPCNLVALLVCSIFTVKSHINEPSRWISAMPELNAVAVNWDSNERRGVLLLRARGMVRGGLMEGITTD